MTKILYKRLLCDKIWTKRTNFRPIQAFPTVFHCENEAANVMDTAGKHSIHLHCYTNESIKRTTKFQSYGKVYSIYESLKPLRILANEKFFKTIKSNNENTVFCTSFIVGRGFHSPMSAVRSLTFRVFVMKRIIGWES